MYIFIVIILVILIIISLFKFQENFTQENEQEKEKEQEQEKKKEKENEKENEKEKEKDDMNYDDKTLIFLGDSIFDNSIYVNKNESVEYLLRENPKYKIVFLAKDNSIISDVSSRQLNNIPKELNDKKNYIFISIGGNNILNKIATNTINFNSIINIFKEYKELIKEIKERFPNSKLYLFNIYFPTDEKYKLFYDYISEWNTLLNNYINLNNSLKEVTVDKLCFMENDFVNDYEPSGVCSKKIVDNIFSKMN